MVLAKMANTSIRKINRNPIIDKKNAHLAVSFKNCFEAFYLTHEINFRKPNLDIYQFVLKKHNLKATETLFIDDSEVNIESAKQVGLVTYHLQDDESVIDIFSEI